MTVRTPLRWLGAVLAAGLVFSSAAPAAPANPQPRQFAQPDGSLVTAVPRGDEWLSWYETAGGRIAVFNRQSRALEFAQVARVNGRYLLQSLGVRLGQTPPAVSVPALDLWRAWEDARRAAGAEFASYGAAAGSAEPAAAAPASTATVANPDVFKTLVVLVNFTDQRIRSADAVWSQKVFGGYPGAVTAGTVNDYFREVSRGRVWFAPAAESAGTAGDGIVKVSLDQAHPQYANNSGSWQPVLYQALQAADPYVDFAAFDVNGDGTLGKDELQVSFVVAGRESSYGGSQTVGLWGHAWAFPDDSSLYPLLDGMRVGKASGRYMAIGELQGEESAPYDSTIGIIAHELGHSALLLGDLYHAPHDVSGWGLMGNGSWGTRPGERLGATPVHPLGASKLTASLPSGRGLLPATLVTPTTGAQRLDLYHAHAGDGYGLVRVNHESGGFFVIENRKIAGYDEGMVRYGPSIGDSGVLVSYYAGRGSVAIYRADGSTGGVARTHMYYLGNNDRLSPDTTPSSDTPDGYRSDLVLENVSAPGEIMSLDLRSQPYACRQFTASLSQHESAGRAYSVTTGSWWSKKTEYYSIGPGEYLGSAGYLQVTLREVRPSHFEKGECPAGADTVAPVISLLGDATMQLARGGVFTDPGATASDDRDGDISARIVVSGSVDTATVGTYTLRYNVTDAAGNAAAEVRRTVEVVEQAACVEHSGSVQTHINAGRAYQCGSYGFYGCATGSGTNIGSRFLTTAVVLKEQPAGYYELGRCR